MTHSVALGLAAALASVASTGMPSSHAAPGAAAMAHRPVGSLPKSSAGMTAAALLDQDKDLAPRAVRRGAGTGSRVREPRTDYYVNAVQIYPWSDGALYRLYTAPERVSEIALQPGEALVSVAAGDTARWVIGDTISGSGADRRTHVLVKPSASGLRTNLLITTDRRLYRVEIASTGGAAMAGIAWTYPADQLIALRQAQDLAAAAHPVAAGLAVEMLNFAYAISGDRPSWRPVRAFDDGRQVFIQFPASVAQDEAPPLFVLGEGGRAELVNYRLKGRYYVVDRLFGTAELRLGGRRQQVVRISRTGDRRRGRP